MAPRHLALWILIRERDGEFIRFAFVAARAAERDFANAGWLADDASPVSVLAFDVGAFSEGDC